MLWSDKINDTSLISLATNKLKNYFYFCFYSKYPTKDLLGIYYWSKQDSMHAAAGIIESKKWRWVQDSPDKK